MSKSGQKGGIFDRLKSALLLSGTGEESTDKQANSNLSESSHLDEKFALAFTKSEGKFAYCMNEAQLIEELQLIFQDSGWSYIFCIDPYLIKVLHKAGIPSKDLLGLESCQATLTPCESLLADSGNMVMSARVDKSRQLKACPPIQLVVAYTDQLAEDEETAMESLKKKYGEHMPASITLLSPPGKNDETEETLVKQGMNGPKDLFVFLLEKSHAN